MEFIQSIDNCVLQFIQDYLRNPVMDKVFVFITRLGNNGFIWLSLAIILLFFKKTRKCGILIICTVAFVFICGDKVLKHLVGRDRPFVTYPLFPISEFLIKPPTGHSFPSSHAGSSFGAAMAIFFYSKKYGIMAFVLAALIAFSRLYIYVHYPSDILAGIIFGIGICFLTKIIMDYSLKLLKEKGKV